MKEIKPITVALLGICTLFVYSAIWFYKLQKEIHDEAGRGFMGVGHLCIMLVPVVNIVYFMIWVVQTEKNLLYLGASGRNNAGWYVVLSLLFLGAIVVFPMMQAKVNSMLGNSNNKISAPSIKKR